MASYTMRLQNVLDFVGDIGDGRKIGLDDYPMPDFWNEADRTELNQKIIGHYVMREIGQETIGLFTHFLRQRMWEIMPPYVQLYESTKMAFDPFVTVKIATTREDSATETSDRTGSSNGDTSSQQNGRTVSSNTPNTMLEGYENYADNAVDSGATTSGSSNSSTDEKATTENSGSGNSSTVGYQGSPSDMLAKYRATILNIAMMIVADLYDMFMLVWDNTAEMLPEYGRGY